MKKIYKFIVLLLILAFVSVSYQSPIMAAPRIVTSYKTVKVTGIKLDKSSMILTAGGEPGILTATISPYNATNKNVIWKTSNSGVATVINGTVFPLKEGTVVITAISSNSYKKAYSTVIVENPVVSEPSDETESNTESTESTTTVENPVVSEPSHEAESNTTSTDSTAINTQTVEISVLEFPCDDGQYVKGDGIHDDTTGIQKALNSGKAVSFVSDKHIYKVTSELKVPDNCFIDGKNAKVTAPSSTGFKNIFNLINKSNVTIKNLKIISVADQTRAIGRIGKGSNLYGIHVTSTAENASKYIELSNIYGENLEYAIKIDGNQYFNKNITLTGIKTYNCAQPLFMSWVDGLLMKNIDLDQAVDVSKWDHHVYMDGNSRNVEIDTIVARRGTSASGSNAYDIASSTSAYLENIKMTNVSVENLNDESVFAFLNVKNCVVDGFTGDLSSTNVIWYYKVNDVTLTNFNVSGTVTQYIVGGGSLPWSKDLEYNNLITLQNSTANITMTQNLFLGENIVVKDNVFNISSSASNAAFMRLLQGQTAKFVIENNSINILKYPNNTELFDIRESNGADVLINNNNIINSSGVTLNFILADYTSEGGTSKISATNNFYRGYYNFTYVKTLAYISNNTVI